jgi:glycosyltransferase involved in cell wall biosynthesis
MTRPKMQTARIRALPLADPAPELSFVIPAHDEAGNIAETIARVTAEARRLVAGHEIIVIDDGSRDATFDIARQAGAEVPLRVLRLSRNFGKEQAIMAGLQASRGKAVVILDADLQEPLHHLETMLAHRRDGYEMVYAVRAHRADEPRAKRLLTALFYKLLNLGAQTAIPPDARDFRLMDRRVVDALCALPERNRFMKGLYGWVGFRSIAVPFAIAALSILYGLWIAIRTLVFGADVPGWSTLSVAIFLLGGVQLISVGVLGEYLARIFTEVKGRPGFIVAEEAGALAEGS